jgi:3-dehydroquinate dehydratase type I
MLCVTGGERTPGDLARRLAAHAAYPVQEVRLDLLSPWDDAVLPLLRSPRVVATCRTTREGGAFSGSEEEWARLMGRVMAEGPGFLDVEWSIPPRERERLFRARRQTRMVLSWHGMAVGDAVPLRPREPHADILKVAVPLDDVAALPALRSVLAGETRPVVRIGTRDAGVVSRCLYKLFGSPWTYVVPDGTPAVTPGQLTTGVAKAWRVGQDGLLPLGLLGGKGVVRSPGMRVYNRVFSARGLPYIYLPLPTSRPVEALAALESLGFRGLSVTMPAKVALVPVVDELTPEARRLRAVNTVTLRDGRRAGANTDLPAVRDLLAPHAPRRALVLGAGGAARAAVAALHDLGAATTIAALDDEAGEALARDLGGAAVPWSQLGAVPFDCLVNATPCGDDGVSMPVPETLGWEGKVVLDAVISLEPTPLLRQVAQGGGTAIPGTAWWVRQGALQVGVMTGNDLPVAEVREALRGS